MVWLPTEQEVRGVHSCYLQRQSCFAPSQLSQTPVQPWRPALYSAVWHLLRSSWLLQLPSVASCLLLLCDLHASRTTKAAFPPWLYGNRFQTLARRRRERESYTGAALLQVLLLIVDVVSLALHHTPGSNELLQQLLVHMHTCTYTPPQCLFSTATTLFDSFVVMITQQQQQ